MPLRDGRDLARKLLKRADDDATLVRRAALALIEGIRREAVER